MKSLFALALPFVLAFGGPLGCAADASGETGSDENAATADDALSAAPGSAVIANVTATGIGCQPGTWDAKISPNGKDVRVVFEGYAAAVEPGQALSVKDCHISVSLSSPTNYSFSVKSFVYEGDVLLDSPGMSAAATARYYFQGNPIPATEQRTDLTGPKNDSFIFTDTLAATEQVWSPCGASRRLNAQTRLFLKNNAQKTGTGLVSLGNNAFSLRFSLDWRKCA